MLAVYAIVEGSARGAATTSPSPPADARVEPARARGDNCRMHACRQCDGDVEDRFRYCPWCAAPQRTKLVQWFGPHPDVEADPAKALRVSRYPGDQVRPPQLRVSIWDGDTAAAALSLTEDEAARLAAFVAPPRERMPR